MTHKEMTMALRRLGACHEARMWAKGKTLAEVAATLTRADWWLWLAARAGVDRRLVVLAACACARTALVYVAESETRPRAAIETAERWARGEVTVDKVRAAADAAYAYADAAPSSSSSYAADAAADAAASAYAYDDTDDYADADANADADAASASAAAANAAAASASAAREALLALVLDRLPVEVVQTALQRTPAKGSSSS